MSMGYVYILDAFFEYSKGVSCSFYSDGQCEGLKVAGRVTGTDSRAFSLYYSYLTSNYEPLGSGICWENAFT